MLESGDVQGFPNQIGTFHHSQELVCRDVAWISYVDENSSSFHATVLLYSQGDEHL